MELVNKSPVSSAVVFSQVYYYDGQTPEALIGSRRHRFSWQWTPFTMVQPFQKVDALDIVGRGVVDSIQLVMIGRIPPAFPQSDRDHFPPRWLEGDPAFTIDDGAGDLLSGG